ncbi:MAG: STAS domain-containing protein [Candidatus Aminicenantes bacterium]|jgi:anti-anti-sigma factor|nr:STAS domain-containing protein [Candidatus Aminicenantes bacterium]
MTIKVAKEGERTTVFLSGTIDIPAGESLKTTMSDIAGDTKAAEIIVDFKQVDSIGSSAIGALLLSHKEFTARGLKFQLVNVNKDIKSLFKIIKLDKIFKI